MASPQHQDKSHTFIIDAGFVEGCIDKFSRPVIPCRNHAIGGNTVHMDIQNIEKNTDPCAWLWPQSKIWLRDDLTDRNNLTIRRADNQAITGWRHPLWVAKKVKTPGCGNNSCPEQRLAHKGQNQCNTRKNCHKWPSSGIKVQLNISNFHYRFRG